MDGRQGARSARPPRSGREWGSSPRSGVAWLLANSSTHGDRRSKSNRPKAIVTLLRSEKNPLHAAPRRAGATRLWGGHPWPPGRCAAVSRRSTSTDLSDDRRADVHTYPLTCAPICAKKCIKAIFWDRDNVSAVAKLANPHRIKAAHRRRWKCSTGHRVYANNNPVRFTDPLGLYACDGSKSQCATVSAGLKDIETAAGNLKSGSADQSRLNAVLGFYGKEGVENGVTVVFGRAGGNNATANTQGNNVTVTLDLKQMRKNFSNRGDGSTVRSEIAGTIAHEGVHGINGRVNGGNPRNFVQEFATEHNAFEANAAVARGLGVNSAYGVWNTGWASPEAKLKRAIGVSKYAGVAAQAWCNGGGGC